MDYGKSRTTALARRIADLAMRNDWRSGRHVTELELAQALGVSRTPIRRAMTLLADKGALKARENRGFLLCKNGVDLGRINLEIVPAATERLYARILKDRISGALGNEVTQAMLAARYEATRPVLEQVLARLDADGLLLRGGGRVFRFVDAFSDASSIASSYDVRLILEPAALRLASFKADADLLKPLRQRHIDMLAAIVPGTAGRVSGRRRAMQRSDAVALDAEFHNGLAGLSGNPFVAATIRQHIDLRRLLEHDVSSDPWHVALWCREHVRVIDSLLAGDNVAASAGLEAHLKRAQRDALAGLPRAATHRSRAARNGRS